MTAPIPLVVLTGFLGSGKTTLLNRWLDQRGDLAVVINELGEIGIDKDLARRVGAPISLLAGGCVCCAVQGTLRTTLRNLYMARAGGDLPPFSTVLLETTGAADPFGVTAVLEQDAWLRKRFTLRSILTTVDTVAGEAALARFPEALEQVTAADQLLLTKTDRATAAQRGALVDALRRLNPRAGVDDAASADAGLLDRDFPRQGAGSPAPWRRPARWPPWRHGRNGAATTCIRRVYAGAGGSPMIACRRRWRHCVPRPATNWCA